MEGVRIKVLALANGDIYEDCKVDSTMDELLNAINESEFINIRCGNHEILINSEFVVSIEF
jgi:hypothetical protein